MSETFLLPNMRNRTVTYYHHFFLYLSGVVLGCFSGRTGRRCVALCHSAVNDEIRAVDEAGLVASQEENCLSLLDGLSETASGEVNLTAMALFSVVAKPVLEQGSAAFVSMETG